VVAVGGGVTTTVVAEMINEEAEARATAITNLYAYADETYAQAGLVNTMNAEFISATGQTSLASAIDWLVATAGSGTANAQYAVDLKAEITDASLAQPASPRLSPS
jgi:1-aminocyclopropane-1-carboxylate deaminase/D-cysteine desulfhydrase-like pyridoxal-dependent ACC family enzyme